VISPTGELITLNQRKQFELYFGTCGIFGIITEITLKITPNEVKIPIVFGFNDLLNITNVIKGLNSKDEILLIGFSDFEYELRSSALNEYPFYMFVVLVKHGIENQQNKEEFIEMIRKASGVYLGDEFSTQIWKNYLKNEMQLKLNTPVLMLQSIYINIDYCLEVINSFKQLAEKRSINHYFYGLVNKDMKVRLQLFTPTDNDKIIHFLASKGILHKIIKKIYKSNKGNVYTYGMLNSIYLHKYEKDKLNYWREQKKRLDPNYILNPYKIITLKTSFWRINLIFEMNLFWRIIAVKINTAQLVNDIRSDKIENKSFYKKNKGKSNGFQ
jgi:FAD/FMN-containing dehydrogenase